ncbi:MAG: hypothetical protein J6N76_00335, partial [Lachnospiraceae bacterium]|nr:hypothetical protein [Lachnospiraceae bacterium]
AGTYYVWYKVKGDVNHNDVAAAGPLTVDIAKAHFTNITASGNTKYGLAGTIELKEHIAPGGTVGTLSITDADSVLEGAPVLTGTVLSYSFKSVSENVGKTATVTIPVSNATNYKDYSITATLNVINCEHPHTELRNIKEATCTEKGCKGDLYCTECNSLLLKGEEIPINPDNHAFVLASVVSSPDSMTGEIRTYRCSRCGKTYTDPLITSPKTDENGNTTESVAVGGVTVEEVTVDKTTGKETVSTRVWVSGLNSSYTYTGSAIKPSFKVYSGTTLLKEGTDYSVSYKNNKNAGTAYVYIKFKGNYKDTKTETLSFSIAAAKLGDEIIAHQVGVAEKKKAQKPVPVLTWADTGKKVSNQYFNISYSPATVKTAGEYTATITPKSGSKNFTGSTTAKVVVTDKAKLLSSAKVTFSPKSYAYTGGEITPGYTLTLGGITLTEGRDYKRVSLCNNIKPGSAAVIFEGMNGYYGSKTASFKISGRIELDNSSDFTYTYSSSVAYVKGGAKPAVSVKDNKNGVTLTEGTDYTLSYSKNKAVTNGAVIKVKGKGSYKGTVTLYFVITQQSLSALEGNIHAADQFVVKKKLKKPTVTIYDLDGKKLSANRDFTIGAAGTPSGDEKSGTVTVTVYGIGAYTGQAAVTYRYMEKSANISAARLRSKIADQEYTGNAIKLSYAELTNKLYISGSGTSKNLVPGTDFVIASYSSNIKKGTAKVTIRGTGTYAGTKTLSFKIVQRKVNYAGKLWN